ncbi:MAG TPA: hypothetical protein VGB75_11400 [Jatrophihabitans sp.]|jgi:hypothetical protein|uniref:hypothetical protein n=1 Tax=Jatrophihabitans sp. TaxID=1932789 RepID=UPI002F038888
MADNEAAPELLERAPTQIFLGRVALQRDRLLAAGAAADRVADEIPAFGHVTRAALKAALRETDQALAELAERIDRRGLTDTRLERFAMLRTATDRVVGECFALAAGVLTRKAGLDGDACREADEFIAELASLINPSLARPTVPGEEEFLHRGVDVIRRRLPDNGVWDLAVMAHEFGHVLVAHHQRWDTTNDAKIDMQSMVEEGWAAYPRAPSEELFCDAFATFVLGPAYAAALVLHRLDPAEQTAPASSGTHPPDAARAVVVLEALGRLAVEETSETRVPLLHQYLTAAWASLQAQSPASLRLSDDDHLSLTMRTRRAHNDLARWLEPAQFHWPSMTIQEVRKHLEGQQPTAGSAPRATIREVLNAAWLSRVEAWQTNCGLAEGLETRAREAICRTAQRNE